MSLEERLWAKVDASGDCWEWTGSKALEGYGFIWTEGRTRRAHRIAYELLVGPIPDGLTLDHLCRNEGCVNPDHLEPVTASENLLRGHGRAVQNARKAECPRGHPYSYRPSGLARFCKVCAVRGQRDRRLRERDAEREGQR